MVTAVFDGLGNQLFQYAFGVGMARRKREPCEFLLLPNHDNHLARFQADIHWTNTHGDPWMTEERSQPENFGRFRPEILDAPRNSFYVGWWMTEKWFDDHNTRVQIRRDLQPRNSLSDAGKRIAEAIQTAGEKSVFIGIRRREYREYAGLALTLDYYSRAEQFIRERVSDAKFWVFSDDREFALQNFPHPLVCGNHDSRDRNHYEDMHLMSLCHHVVMSNSSFHWWGTWLGDHQANRIVVRPERWAPNHGVDTFPDRWIKLEKPNDA